jgi:glutamate decarboxylase
MGRSPRTSADEPHIPIPVVLNFSRPGAQVLLQYCLFLRLGFAGYEPVQATSRDVVLHLSGEIGALAAFTVWSDGSDIGEISVQRIIDRNGFTRGLASSFPIDPKKEKLHTSTA